MVGVLLAINSTAQDNFRSVTSLGINSGINLCRVSFNPSINQQLFFSNSTGIIFRHVSEPHIGLQIELNIARKGWIENRDTIGNYKRNIQIMDIPAMAVFVFGSNQIRLSFTIGPYLSYRRKEKETIEISDTAFFRDYYHKPLENKLEFGFIAGLGIEMHTRIGIFALRGSYSHSLSNLFPLNVPEFYYEDSRMQVVNVGILYMVNL